MIKHPELMGNHTYPTRKVGDTNRNVFAIKITKVYSVRQVPGSENPRLKEFRQFYHLDIFAHSGACIYVLVLNFCRKSFRHGFFDPD